MNPKKREEKPQLELYRTELKWMIDDKHPLVKLAGEIDWSQFDNKFGRYFKPDGRPAIETRLMVSLHYLKYSNNLSDEAVVYMWVENPYWQYFSGRQHFEHELPINPSSMTRWRKRIGPKGSEKLLKELIETGIRTNRIKSRDLDRVSVDTTVQTKAIRYPTDARLYDRMREVLVRYAKNEGIILRQSYKREGKRLLQKQQNYTHARQYKRSKRMTRKLKTILGRVIRDIERKRANPSAGLREKLDLAIRVVNQERDSKNKIYSIHEPDVSCIAKGKVHRKYEFGSKAGFVVSAKGNWILGAYAFAGNPYDGHTLEKSLRQCEKITGKKVKQAVCDQGYRGHNVTDTEISIVPRRKNKASRILRKWWRRRNAIEPLIGHQKSEHRLERNRLAGIDGDKINVILSACGFNIKKLLRAFCAWIQYRVKTFLMTDFQHTNCF